jgi:aryl-alcohol dehydrogenase-like predicted oxidoreductase
MMMRNKMTRREYLSLTAAAAAAATLGSSLGCGSTRDLDTTRKKKSLIPTRVLGKTGVEVPIIGFGTGSKFQSAHAGREDEAVQLLHHAVDLGINWLETAHIYGKDGWAEKMVGQVLKTRRKEVFVTTKIHDRTYDVIMRQVEISLERLQTDHVDLLLIHWLKADETDTLGQKGYSVETFYKLREQKVARFIGVSSHDQPLEMKRFIERYDFDCVQMALNAAMVGVTEPGWRLAPEVSNPSFEAVTVPAARKKNMGVIAMKTLGYGHLLGSSPDKADAQSLIRYAWSLPIASAMVGMTSVEEVEQNARWASTFQKMSQSEMRELSNRLSLTNRAALEGFFAHHGDSF